MKQRLLAIALLLGPLAWLFGGALTGDEMFAFRDAAHYYYPYYQFVAEQWADGIPLWNMQENMGQPLLADATAAVLYPGKLIFALPFAYGTNFHLYIVAHVLLAAMTAFIAARGFATSFHAATICALSYAFSGSVLFQYCNIIFLVGAAWLPLAMLATHRMLRDRSYRWAVGLAAILAMMIFGGDPQMAYHVMLIAVLYAVVIRKKYDGLPRPSSVDGLGSPSYKVALLRSRPALLIATGVFFFTLAAVQILPSAQWSRGSTRAAYDAPRNIYEWAASNENAKQDNHAFLLGQLSDGHQMDSYNYSVGPWHAAGYLWPNCFGQVFPTNTRWIRALPAEDRTWTPTLYMGLLPLLLALSQLRLRLKWDGFVNRGDGLQIRPTPLNALRSWLTYTVVLALLAALGWYSLGWLASEIYHVIYGANVEPLPIGWPFGGLYWLMQTVLPGYVYFRYPAKWLVIAAMGLSLLAAGGWDQLVTRGSRFVTRGLLAVAILSMAMLLLGALLLPATSAWQTLCDRVSNDALFGPLVVEQAGRTLMFSFLHTTIVAGLLWWLMRRWNAGSHWAVPVILLITAIDLSVAQRGLVPTTPIHESVAEVDDSAMPTRAYRRSVGPPSALGDESSPMRLAEIVKRDRQTLLPKNHLLTDIEIINSTGSMTSLEHTCFVREVARRRMLPWAAAELVVDGPRRSAFPSSHGSTVSWAEIVHEVRRLPLLETHSPRDIRQRTNDVLNLIEDADRNIAVVESDRHLPQLGLVASDDAEAELCQIATYQAELVQLRVTLHENGLVLLRDSFAPGWTCEVTDRATGKTRVEPILRTNRVMRGVWLPAGEYDVTFCYRPATFQWGTVISGFGWLVALIFAGAILYIRKSSCHCRVGSAVFAVACFQ